MNKSVEKINKYLSINAVKGLLSPPFSDKKITSSPKISDKALVKDIYSWDPTVRQFIILKRV